MGNLLEGCVLCRVILINAPKPFKRSPAGFSQSPLFSKAEVGTDVTLSCTLASSDYAATLQWYKDESAVRFVVVL